MKNLFLFISILIFSATANSAESDDSQIIRAIIKEIVINETGIENSDEITKDDFQIAVKSTTAFPNELTDRLKSSEPFEDCIIAKSDWVRIIENLNTQNKKSNDITKIIKKVPFAVVGTRPKFDDYLAFSNSYIDGNKAYISIGLSEWAGEISMLTKKDKKWGDLTSCAEWARF